MSTDYSDDRYGEMRIHIASERSRLACQKYARDTLRAHAATYGVSTAYPLKSDLAWYMAQNGLIDAEGNLRAGFPAAGAA